MDRASKTLVIANISRQTYYQWINRDEDFKLRVAEKDVVVLHNIQLKDKKRVNIAEDMLFANVEKGDNTSIIFFLKKLIK